MSSSDLSGFGELAAELRAARPLTPTGLREHVLALGDPPSRRARRSLRRPALLLVPVGLAAAGAVALAIGLAQSGGGGRSVVHGAPQALEAAGPAQSAGTAAAVPAPGTRAKRYEVALTLRVDDLSAQTKRALRLTRELGGYVRTVDYGQGPTPGTARLVVRIPVTRVQTAIVRFSALGTILDQQVSVRDVQSALDLRTREIQGLEDRIATLVAEGTPQARARVAALRRSLVELQREQARALRAAGFATVSLSLETRAAHAVAPSRPGRIERALDRAGAILVDELVVLLYVLVVGVPLALLVAVAFLAGRLLRRRSLDRLLEQS